MKVNTLPPRATEQSALQIKLPDAPHIRTISYRRGDGALREYSTPFFCAQDASAAQDQALARHPDEAVSYTELLRTYGPSGSLAKDEIFERRDSAMMEALPKAALRRFPGSINSTISEADPTLLPSTELDMIALPLNETFSGLEPRSTRSTLDRTPRATLTPGIGQGLNKRKRRRQDDLVIDGVGLDPLDQTPQYRHLATDGKWYTDATVPAGKIPSWAVRSEQIENDSTKSRSRRATRRSRENS